MAKSNGIYGLVLAGGKSLRMGTDKGLLAYRKIPQREFLLQELNKCCEKAFISCRKDQTASLPHKNYIADRFDFPSPINGILSALNHERNKAWLIVACDMPFITVEVFTQLISKRDENKLATAYLDTDGKYPEPMLSIWEPTAYPLIMEFVNQGKLSPRQFLIEHDIALANCPSPHVLTNVNTLQEFNKVQRQI